MATTSWQEIYLQSVLEVSGPKMQERIAAARAAIGGRLRELENDSDHHTERQAMVAALSALKALEVETRTW